MMLLIVIIVLMAGIALAAYFYGRRYKTARASRGKGPCRDPNEDGGNEHFQESDSAEYSDFDDGADGD